PRSAGAAEGSVLPMFIEFGLNLLGSPDKDDADAEVTRSLYGSLDLAGWSVIATHRVHSDLKHKPLRLRISDCGFRIADLGGVFFQSAIRIPQSEIDLLFFFHLDGNAPTIEPTLWANAVRRARLPAMGTGPHRGWCQMIVRPALAGARLGMLSFRIWHYVLLISVQFRFQFSKPGPA